MTHVWLTNLDYSTKTLHYFNPAQQVKIVPYISWVKLKPIQNILFSFPNFTILSKLHISSSVDFTSARFSSQPATAHAFSLFCSYTYHLLLPILLFLRLAYSPFIEVNLLSTLHPWYLFFDFAANFLVSCVHPFICFDFNGYYNHFLVTYRLWVVWMNYVLYWCLYGNLSFGFEFVWFVCCMLNDWLCLYDSE